MALLLRPSKRLEITIVRVPFLGKILFSFWCQQMADIKASQANSALRQPQLRTKLKGSKMNNKLIGAFDVIVVNYSGTIVQAGLPTCIQITIFFPLGVWLALI